MTSPSRSTRTADFATQETFNAESSRKGKILLYDFEEYYKDFAYIALVYELWLMEK